MAVFQIEAGTATGRGFDSAGYLGKFKAWVVKSAVNGGPAWTILYDKSATPVSNGFTAVAATDLCTAVAHGLVTGDTIQVSNSGGGLPGNLSAATDYYVIKIDADTFKIATAMSGAQIGTVRDITSAGTGTHSFLIVDQYIVVSDQAAPTINQACKILKVSLRTSEAATVRVQMCLSFDTTNKILYGYWSGYRVATVDAGEFAYDFRGGAECMILSSRISTNWYVGGIDEWVGDANFVEATDKTGTLASGATAGSSVVLQLGSGQAANFTINNYYYIYDFQGHSWVNYCKVTARDTGANTITVDSIANNFPSGAAIAAYAHRFYTFQKQYAGNYFVARMTYSSSGNAYSQIPYMSGPFGYVFPTQDTYPSGQVVLDIPTVSLGRLNPNDFGNYACSKGLLVEWAREVDQIQTGMNRAYGSPKNLYHVYNNSYASAQDGKTIGGKNYLFFLTGYYQFSGGSNSHCVLILDSASTS